MIPEVSEGGSLDNDIVDCEVWIWRTFLLFLFAFWTFERVSG